MANTQYQVYERQFTDTLTHLIETGDRPYLIDAMTVDTDIKGQTKLYKYIGTLGYQKKTGRNEIAILDEPDYSSRHMQVGTYYSAPVVDAEDTLRMVQDPKADIYQEAIRAINSAKTAVAMNGFFDTYLTNEDASGTSTFDTTNNRIADTYSGGTFGQNSGAASVGLNIDKLLAVRLKAANNQVIVSRENPLHIAVSEADVQALLGGKIGSDNYPAVDRFNAMQLQLERAMDNTADNTFSWLNFMFHVVPVEFFLTTSSKRRLPVWQKDGMVFGIAKDIEGSVEKLPSTVESVKMQALTRVGSMRKHDKKVYEILVA